MLVTRGLSVLIGMVFVVLMARWLGSEGYGRYFFTITLANFLALPILAGLPTLMVREIAQARSKQDSALIAGILRWSVWFVLISSLTVGIIGGMIFALPLGSGDLLPIYSLALPLIVALGVMHLASAYLQGQEQPVLGNLPDGLIRPGLLLLLAACMALIGRLTAEIAIIAHILAAVLAAIWAILAGRRIRRSSENALPFANPRYETRAWLAGLLPLSLITGAALLNNRLDVMMLGWLADISEVGRYGIALQIAGLAAIGPTIINSIIQPRAARLYGQKDLSTLQHEVTHAARLALGLALLASVVLAILSKPVILNFIGEDFSGAIPALLILASGRVLLSTMGPVGNILNMTGNERTTAWLTVAFSLVNAILNAFLIPLYGALGAAWATMVSLFALHITMLWYAHRLVGVDTTAFGWRAIK